MLHSKITHQILVTFFDVYNELGPGFLESTYRESIRIALSDVGMSAVREVPIDVTLKSAFS